MSPSIQQATTSDTNEIVRFLDHAPLVHRHLDWIPLLDWIDSIPFLKYYSNDTLQAIFVCPPDPPGVAWIKCFACNQGKESSLIFRLLITHVIKVLQPQINHIYALGLNDWFINILQNNDFEKFQDVIVLKYNGKPLEKSLSHQVLIRPMELVDTEHVTQIDQRSFEPIWAISQIGLKSAFFQAEHTSVAEIDGKIIGYQLSTASHFSAHLARVAVLPEWRQEDIGYQLVREMIEYFLKRGINEITVNTQDSNRASLSLYNKIGFIPTGDRFPIFRTSLAPITGQ